MTTPRHLDLTLNLTDDELDSLTEEEYSERLVKIQQANVMGRARAAVCFLNSTANASPEAEVYAFLSVFHPEIDDDRKRRVARLANE